MNKNKSIIPLLYAAPLLALVSLITSCTASPRYSSVNVYQTSRAKAYEATVQVMTHYFPIAKADPKNLVVKTGYRKQRGDSIISAVPGMVLKPFRIRQKPFVYRWKGEALVVTENGLQIVKLRIRKQREDTTNTELYPTRQYETSGRFREEASIRHTGRYWTDLGRDHEFEMKIAREIRGRLRHAGLKPPAQGAEK